MRQRRRARRRAAPRRLLTLASSVLTVGISACRTAPGIRTKPQPPTTDFLLAAGDSTFWITSGPQGVRVRGSPLLLAHYGGRFYEVYVADEDHSFYDAVFTTQRIYRRDLLSGDSAAVFRDTSVGAAARRYAGAHPGQQPLAPDEDASDDPSLSITGEVDILDVDGPYLSYEYRGTQAGGATGSAGSGGREDAERETLWRGVADLRSAARATLRSLFGQVAAESLITQGYQEFSSVSDSVRAARATGDERARRAAAALTQFTFDPLSFSLSDVDRAPVVQFFAPGHGVRGGGLTLPLPPIPVPGSARAPWWGAESESLPVGGADSATDLWQRDSVEIVARYDTLGAPEQGQGVVLSLRLADGARRGLGSSRREWRVGRFPAPTRRVYWLERAAVDSATRRALVRAFDEAALYGDDARSASFRHMRATTHALGFPHV